MEHQIASAYPAEDCVQRFLERENEKALSLGAKDTTVTAPSGYDWFTRSTPRDMVQIGRAAMQSDVLRTVWGTKTREITTRNDPARTILLETTVTDPELEESYRLVGGKTGFIMSKQLNRRVQNLTAVCEKDGRYIVAAVMGAARKKARFTAMLELMRCAFGDDPESRVTAAQCAYAEDLMTGETCYPPAGVDGGADTFLQTASMIKILTALTALDFIDDLNEIYTIDEADLRRGSGNVFEAGDRVRLIDLIYAAMLPSSNTAAMALAHWAGGKFLAGEKEGIRS